MTLFDCKIFENRCMRQGLALATEPGERGGAGIAVLAPQVLSVM